MNNNTILLLVSIGLIICQACYQDDTPKPQSSSINKIMPLGASRVEGNRPDFESFRFELWKDLKANNWTFDFIGTQSDEGDYPLIDDEAFDIDHEGRGGWTSAQILDGLGDWLIETGSPDIVLFSSPGGNDGLQSLPYAQTVINIEDIIEVLQEDNPSVTILIEQLAPGHTSIMDTDLTNYFNQLQAAILTIATEKTTSTSQVIAVDMSTGFTNNFLADDVHYNETGADFIATKYYNVLVDVLEQE